MKVGPPPKQSGVQIVPPFYAYSGHRGMERVLLDLKSPAGRDAFLRLAARADVVIESFRPGVVDRLGHRTRRRCARQNPRIVYCSTSGYGQTGPRSQWAGHDLNYLAVGGYLDCSGRGADGGPALPGATIGDAAGGGMQAVIAILAALVHRAATGEGATLDVSVADGVVALMSLYVDEYLATGEVPGAAPQHPHRSLRLLRRVPLRRRPVDRGRRRSNRTSSRTCAARSAASSGSTTRPTTRCRTRCAPTSPRRSRAGRATSGLPSSVRPTRACRRSRRFRSSCTTAQFRARDVFVRANAPGHGEFEQVGWVFAGMDRDQPGPTVRDATITDTDALLGEVGYSRDEIAALREEGVAA